MMAAWMVYSVLVASLLGLAAATTDRFFAIWSLPRRYLWLGAMLIAGVVPFAAATRSAPSRLTPPPLVQPPVRTSPLAGTAASVAPLRIPLAVRAMQVWGLLRPVDRTAQ